MHGDIMCTCTCTYPFLTSLSAASLSPSLNCSSSSVNLSYRNLITIKEQIYTIRETITETKINGKMCRHSWAMDMHTHHAYYNWFVTILGLIIIS